jgi:hypothetical protein
MVRAIARQTATCVVLFVLLLAGTAYAKHETPNPFLISDCTTITQPGSYVLTNNIVATPSSIITVTPPGFVSTTACIVITADFVTLDLAGFVITGSELGASCADGIATTEDVDHYGIYVHSGTVANFSCASSGVGVFLYGNGHTVEHIRALKNHDGIIVLSFTASHFAGHRIVGNTAISNPSTGIFVECPAVVLENTAAGNGSQIQENGACTSLENSPLP